MAGAPNERVEVAWVFRSDSLLGEVFTLALTRGADGTLTAMLPR